MDENSVNKLTVDLDNMCSIADPPPMPIPIEIESNMETWKFERECEHEDSFQLLYRTFFSVSGESNKRAEMEEKIPLETTDMSSPPSPSSSLLRCTNSSLISQNSRMTEKLLLLKAQRLKTIFKKPKWNQSHALRGTGHICPRFVHCHRQFNSQPKFPLVPVPVPLPVPVPVTAVPVPVVRSSSSGTTACNLSCHGNNNNNNLGMMSSRTEGLQSTKNPKEVNPNTVVPFDFFRL